MMVAKTRFFQTVTSALTVPIVVPVKVAPAAGDAAMGLRAALLNPA